MAVRTHAAHSIQYLENGLIALRDLEAGKAGELLWGSVAQALEAVAVHNSHTIQSHRDLKNFAIQLSKDLEDEAILEKFVLAESLHQNFYAVQQEPLDIEILVPTVKDLVARLIDLIPPEILAVANFPRES